MSNIIEFPKIKVDSPPQSPDELEAKISDFKEEYSNEIAEFLWRNILGELVRSGCNFTEIQDYFPSMVLVLESIRSLHLQSQGLHHNLQDFARDCIDIEGFEKKMVDIDEEMD